MLKISNAITIRQRVSKLRTHPWVVRFLGARSPGRFIVVGGVNTLVGMAAFPVLYGLWGGRGNINQLLVIAWVLCTVFAFLTHKHITFRSAGRDHRQVGKFAVLSLATLGINLVVVNAATHYLRANPALAQFVTSVVLSSVLMVLNYFGMSRIIFKSSN